MLENRSFDHMLGFSGIGGIDRVAGGPTPVRALTLSGTSLRALARNCEQNSASGIVLTSGENGPSVPYFPLRPAFTEPVERLQRTDLYGNPRRRLHNGC